MEQIMHHPDIQEILWTLYHTDNILAQNVMILDTSGKISVKFHFPSYKKSKLPLAGEHVSANQIHEAIMEGMYLAIWAALKNHRFLGLDHPISYEDFLSTRAQALYRELHIKYKNEVFQNHDAELIFWIADDDIKNVRSKFSTVVVSFDGFVIWKAKAVLRINDFIKTIL